MRILVADPVLYLVNAVRAFFSGNFLEFEMTVYDRTSVTTAIWLPRTLTSDR